MDDQGLDTTTRQQQPSEQTHKSTQHPGFELIAPTHEQRRMLGTQAEPTLNPAGAGAPSARSHSIHTEGEASVLGVLQFAERLFTFSATLVCQGTACTVVQQKHWICLKYAEVCEGTSTLHLMDESGFPAATSEDIVYSVMSCI